MYETNSFPVTFQCESYIRQRERWSVCRDTIEGEDVVKDKGVKYLPMASGKDNEGRKARYDAYKARTPFAEFVGTAHSIQHAMIFRRCPTIHVEDNFRNSKLLDDVDGKGSSLYQFTSDSVWDLLKTGFGAWMLDVSQSEMGLSQLEAEKKGIRPYLTYYPAESVINWQFDNSNGQKKLKLVVLLEKGTKVENEFQVTHFDRYRVLLINEKGYYEQRIYTPVFDEYDKTKIKSMDVKKIPVFINKSGKSEQINYIPLVLLPTDKVDRPPLFGLAMMNVHHYQLTADYVNGVHMTTVPTGYITGYTKPDNDEEADIVLGGDAFLTEENSDAKFGVLSFSGEGLEHCEKAIDKLEAQIAGLFMKSIAPDKKTSETAEAAYVHRSGENAKLATFARNISEKLSQIIQWYAEWNGYIGLAEIHLNYDYETMSLDPNIINSIANIAGQGKFPLYCVFYILQQQELIDPDMNYDDFIFLIDQERLEGNSAQEIYEAFKKRLSEKDGALKLKK